MLYKSETLKKYNKMMSEKIHEFMTKDIDTLSVSISNGNTKIGRVMNVSTPAIFTCGNCKECKKYCYDIKANLFHTNSVLPSRAKNLVILLKGRDKFFAQIDAAMNKRRKNKFFRWHVAGEIIDYDYFCRMVDNAKKHSDFIIWTYTKNYAVVNAYCDNNGGRNAIPANFKIMFSEWDGMPMDNPYNFPIFTCKLEKGNKNHDVKFFDGLYKCPGNCDICKAACRGCIAGESTYADEH